MKKKLQALLKKTVKLFVDCELDQPATWLRSQLQRLDDDGNSPKELKKIAASIRSNIAGMGSLSDFYLQPASGCKLTEKEANEKKWMLLEELGDVTGEILS
jgi:hypothetical protein